MGREWLGESWFRLKPETEIPEKKDAEIEEAKKVEGVRDPEQDMDEFFLDWVYVEDRAQPDPIDQDQAEREVFREQRQLDEEGEVKEQAQEVDVPKHRVHNSVRSTDSIMQISNLGVKLASKDKDEMHLLEEARKTRKNTSSTPTTCSSVWMVRW